MLAAIVTKDVDRFVDVVSGVVTFAEVHTISGRSDLLLSHQGHTWVIELKVAFAGQNPKKKAEEALQKIIDKNYASPYPDAVCVGMAIDDTLRLITDTRMFPIPAI